MYHDLIVAAAKKYDLDADMLEAQVIVESSGQTDAFRFEPAFYKRYVQGKKAAGAQFGPLAACSYGLLQIMLVVAYEIGYSGRPEVLFVPEVGLDWGAKYFDLMLAWAGGDYTRALCAYNGGRGGNVTPPYRNQAYADRVLLAKENLLRA